MAVNQNEYKGQALIYCRVSTGHQETEGTSLESQEVACRKQAQELGYEVARVYHEVYSGAELFDRPELTRLRQDIRTGEYQAVLVFVVDRITRKQGTIGYLLLEFEKAGVELISVLDPLDTSLEGRLLLSVKEYMAEAEREKIKERSLRGKRQRLTQGKLHNYALELYGYRRDKERGVRLIYRWYTEEGMGIQAIARRLNALGVPPPSQGKIHYKDPLRVAHWGIGSIHRILSEPSYRGESVVWRLHKGERRDPSEHIRLPAGTTPAIVPDAAWEIAQGKLATNRGTAARNQKRPYLLRGLVRCAVCGLSMQAEQDQWGRVTYRCRSRQTPAGACGAKGATATDVLDRNHFYKVRPRDERSKFAPQDEELSARIKAQTHQVQGMDSWVWESVLAFLRDPSRIEQELERQRQTGPDPSLTSDVEIAESALDRVEKQQARVVQRYAQTLNDTDFPSHLLEQEIKRLEAEKQQLAATLLEARERLSAQRQTTAHLEALVAYCQQIREDLEDPETFSFEEKRLALDALGVQVTANGRDWELTMTLALQGGTVVASQFP
jgi:site-specific DNA recombinase